jgi:prevent-host-death family protein
MRGYFGFMQTVGIKLLKDNLSAYVRAAEAGDTILVTDRGRIVAELVPPRALGSASTEEEILAELSREGILAAPKRRATSPPTRTELASFEDLMDGLGADRGDR